MKRYLFYLAIISLSTLTFTPAAIASNSSTAPKVLASATTAPVSAVTTAEVTPPVPQTTPAPTSAPSAYSTATATKLSHRPRNNYDSSWHLC